MQVVDELRRMTDERFLSLYESLAQNGFGPLDGEVAKALKFRPQAIRKLPMAQRARRARAILLQANNAELTYELFGSYLLKTRKQLISSFLDETGVEHDEGMIGNVEEDRPAVDKLDAAVAKLDGEHPEGDVTLYLSMCATQWHAIAELDAAWRRRWEA